MNKLKKKIVAVSGRTDAAGGEEWPEKEQEDEQKRWGKKKATLWHKLLWHEKFMRSAV